MSNTEIDRFIGGLSFVDDPWADRAYEPEKPAAPLASRIGLHCAAAGLGLVLGTVLWQAIIYVTVAEVMMATAMVR